MELLEYYKKHGIMTEITSQKSMVDRLPQTVEGIVKIVQNIILHEHWVGHYGVELDDKKRKEPWIRSVNDKLIHLREKGFTHVSDRLDHQSKIIGICRDFTLLAVSLCREVGIPARARCGFVTYFEKGKYIDHWLLEYWNYDTQKWTYVDAQLDPIQQKILKIDFNPLDVNEALFLTGPKAWELCRSGQVEAELFGIYQWWGYDYIVGNLLLDANALLKLPLQPWDGWDGYKNLPISKWTLKDYKIIDTLSKLVNKVDDDFNALYNYINIHDTLKVPNDLSRVTNYLK